MSAHASNGRHRRGVTVAQLAEAKKLPETFLRLLGVEDHHDEQRHQDEVRVPYLPVEGGQPVAVRRRTALRAVDGSFWAEGSAVTVYGAWKLDEARRAGHVYIVEGETSCWCGWSRGLPVLGVPGASMHGKLDKEHVEGVERIYIVQDPDAAGGGLVDGLARRLACLRWPGEAFVVRLPVKDLADLHSAHHDDDGFAAALEAAVAAAEPLPQAPKPNAPPGAERPEPAAADDSRPLIVIDTDEQRVNDEADAALAADPTVYHRGGVLVHVVDGGADAGGTIRRPPGAPVVRALPPAVLRERLSSAARWAARDAEGGLTSRRPPAWCVQAVAARGSWRGVRRLDAVATHPVLLENGDLLAAPGYHPGARLLLHLPPGLSLSVPERPTRAEALAALRLLLDVVADFPFETPAHRAAWVAALLTPLAWFAFDGPAPLFLIDGNTRGAGKGLLADVIAFVVFGRRFAVMPYTADPDELRKRITSLAIAGDRAVLLDNLAGVVGNAVLDAALTADTWNDRLLGANATFNGPLGVVWYATANNAQLGADTARRICHVRIESSMERPELREDVRERDLRGHVRRHRGELLSAALTLLRGWFVAGMPRQALPAWGSFEGWSDVVRQAVAWLGLPDPGETRLRLQTGADRDDAAMSALLVALEQMAGRQGATAAAIIDTLKSPPSPLPPWHPDLRAAVEDLAGKLDTRTLGNRLRHFARRNFGGRFLDRAGTAHQAARWAVYPAAELRTPRAETDSPDSPDSPPAEGSRGSPGSPFGPAVEEGDA